MGFAPYPWKWQPYSWEIAMRWMQGPDQHLRSSTKSLFSMDEEGHPVHGSRCSVNGVHQLSLSSGQSPRGALKKIERQMFPEILMRIAYTVCQLLAAQLLGFSSADCAARITYVDARAPPSVAWVNKNYDFSRL